MPGMTRLDCNWPNNGRRDRQCRSGAVRWEGGPLVRRPRRFSQRPPGRAYLAVFVLFCLGFLGVLAFLSTSTSGWLGRCLQTEILARLAQRRNDLAPDPFELLALVAVHEVHVELGHPGVGEHVELVDDLRDLAEDAEAVGDLVADEAGIRRPDLRVVVIVVPGPVLDVAGE